MFSPNLRGNDDARLTRLLARATSQDLTYRERGATLLEQLPTGYRHVSSSRVLGQGQVMYDLAVQGLRTWRAHEGANLRIHPVDAPVTTDQTILATWSVGTFTLALPCRIVAVVNEDRRYAFAYGTLPGHPETGEELFEVRWCDDDDVVCSVRAFSKPDRWFARLGGPVTRSLQDRTTREYVRALNRFVHQR